MRQFIKSFCGSIGFLSDETVWNGLVIYSEGGAYAPYISGMLHSLEITYSGKAYYLTSDPADPLLRDTPRHLRAFFIGKGIMRTIVFNTMRTKVLAMTMPDLNTFHIKRSPKAQRLKSHIRKYLGYISIENVLVATRFSSYSLQLRENKTL